MRGEAGWSWRYNPFGVIALGIVIFYAIRLFLGARVRSRIESSRTMHVAGMALLIAFFVFGVVRMVIWHTSGRNFPDYQAPTTHDSTPGANDV